MPGNFLPESGYLSHNIVYLLLLFYLLFAIYFCLSRSMFHFALD